MATNKKSKSKSWLNVLVSFIIIALIALIYFNKQFITDQIIVWRFKPTKEISLLAEKAGLNNNGKFYYYSGQPSLETSSSFNGLCKRAESTTSILGCYSNNRIYIFNVTDTRLDGVREVTAAHETLHAVYQRLSNNDKNKLDDLLEQEYNKIKNNKEFSSRMDFYARTEPDQIDNELFSVIGTEVADINSELESYYSKYFSDRKKVVNLNIKYISVFNQLKSQADEIRTELERLNIVITNDTKQYNIDVAVLDSDITVFNNRANSGDFSSQQQFDIERAELLARVEILNLKRESIIQNTQQYELLIIQYNLIATELEKLQSSLDSTLAPAPSI